MLYWGLWRPTRPTQPSSGLQPPDLLVGPPVAELCQPRCLYFCDLLSWCSFCQSQDLLTAFLWPCVNSPSTRDAYPSSALGLLPEPILPGIQLHKCHVSLPPSNVSATRVDAASVLLPAVSLCLAQCLAQQALVNIS